MTVGVNSISNDTQGRNTQLLATALGLARDVYKVRLDDKQLTAANKIKEQQLAAEEAKNTLELARKESADKLNFNKDVAQVPEGTKNAFSMPGREGLFLPRADIRAREQNQTALAGKNIDRNIAASDRDFTKTQKLSDDYNKESKETVSSIDAYKKLEASALNPNPSGATDVTLLVNFFKTIDPGSTVREGEFATAEQAPGVSARYLNLYNKVATGERLSPESRAQFLEEGKRLLQSRLSTQEQIDDRYKNKAENFKVDPAYVVNQNFAELKKQLGDLNNRKQQQNLGPLPPQDGTAYGASGPAANPIMQPGTIFKDKVTGKRMRVNADGHSATEI